MLEYKTLSEYFTIWGRTHDAVESIEIKYLLPRCYLKDLSISPMACSFSLFTTLAYTCVVVMLLCPSKVDTVYRFAPKDSSKVAKVWRAQWNVISLFLIPML